MKKEISSKKIIIFIFASIFITIILFAAEIAIYKSIPDYMRYDEIPKGYTQREGYSNCGKDLNEFFSYYYTENQIKDFEKSNLYKAVNNDNIDELIEMIKYYEELNDLAISNNVSDGDYFILKYFNSDGNEIAKCDDNCLIYFFDTDTQILYYIRYTI